MSATEPSSYALWILDALQDRPQYTGTVSAKVIARRRAKARVARKSRRLNRAR